MKRLISQPTNIPSALYHPHALELLDRHACRGFEVDASLPVIRKSIHSSPLKD